MINNNPEIREKFKPMTKLYWSIIIPCIIIRFIPASTGFVSIDDAINDFVIGAMASTVVAWLMDIANCRAKNKELNEKERYAFSEYVNAVFDFCYQISKMGTDLVYSQNSLSIKEWLKIISSLDNYGNETAGSSRRHNYQYIVKYIKKIKKTILLLKQQHFWLVEANIVDTYDFHQHADFQIGLCEIICESLEGEEISEYVIEEVNEQIDTLIGNCRLFFPDTLPERINWMNSKG